MRFSDMAFCYCSVAEIQISDTIEELGEACRVVITEASLC